MPSQDQQVGVSNRGKVSPSSGKGKAAKPSHSGRSKDQAVLSSENDEGANKLK